MMERRKRARSAGRFKNAEDAAHGAIRRTEERRNKVTCGCRFEPGRPVHYSDLRAHLDHIRTAIEEAAGRCLMLELVQDPKETDFMKRLEWSGPLSEVRMKVVDALSDWDEKARPALDKRFPENKIAEALGL